MHRSQKLLLVLVCAAGVLPLLAAVGCSEAAPSREPTQLTPAAVLAADVELVRDRAQAKPGVFIAPYLNCRDALPADTASEPAAQVCTHVAISGCTEPGKYFPDYGSCDVVRTQRPFWPEAPAAEPRADDPRLNDPVFMNELAFFTEQVEACACTCCHDARQNQGQTAQWDIQHGPIWLDTLSNAGLALFAGYADSSSLGAYDSADNHGFDRMRTGIPTTDSERTLAFLRAELERRGISEDAARSVPPFGGPIYTNRIKAPDACSDFGHGIDPELRVQFGTAKARYVYVLADGSANPGVPPNLDLPSGTLWRLDVLASAEPIGSGFLYGATPSGSFQTSPKAGRAPKLERGRRYQLVALRDVGVPITSCWFDFGAKLGQGAVAAAANGGAGNWAQPSAAGAAPAADSCTLPNGDAAGFGAACTNDAACSCSANYCAIMPGQSQGSCTRQGCKADPGLCPNGWACFDLSAFAPGLPAICTKS